MKINFRITVENVINKTKLTLKNDTRFMKVCQSLVYIIILDPETSNLRLSEFTQKSLETSDMSKSILNALGKSFYILLENLHRILIFHDGNNLEVDLQWVQALLLYSSQFLRNMTAGNLMTCHDELVSIWFFMMEKQVQFTREHRQNIQWNKIISCLQMIATTLSNESNTFLFMSNLIMNEIWTNPESERYWDPEKSSNNNNITSELQVNMQKDMSVLKTTEMMVDKDKSFVDRKVVYRPRLQLYRKNWTYKKPIRIQNTWQSHFENCVIDSPVDECYVSNAINTATFIKMCCLRPDLLAFDNERANKLIQLLMDKFTTVEPSTSVTIHAMIPKGTRLLNSRDWILNEVFKSHLQYWILLDYLSNVNHEKYRELHDFLIRALFAQNIQFWHFTQKSNPQECRLELDAAIRLIDSMRKAGDIRPPMTEVGRVLPYLNTSDIYNILYEVWKFIMENWQQCPYSDNFMEQQENNDIGEINYEERVRNIKIIVQKNILKIPDELEERDSIHFVPDNFLSSTVNHLQTKLEDYWRVSPVMAQSEAIQTIDAFIMTIHYILIKSIQTLASSPKISITFYKHSSGHIIHEIPCESDRKMFDNFSDIGYNLLHNKKINEKCELHFVEKFNGYGFRWKRYFDYRNECVRLNVSIKTKTDEILQRVKIAEPPSYNGANNSGGANHI
ncbi:19870_t:CDS:2 [Funneliformis geosporum]|uniref:19870_t:CDS:1 n=1 Tax=Funneliformis geosporum TaxID=1117311 RepID=A0A9W4SGS1_9GLOM|nr:19870_t:CDS:2 [Funneliformis geosporum]